MDENVFPYFKTRIKGGNLNDTYNRCLRHPWPKCSSQSVPSIFLDGFSKFAICLSMTGCHFGQVLLTRLYIAQFFFYLTISNNTHHSKGAYGSNLKDLILGGRCKTFYRKNIFRCPLFKRLVNRKTMSKFVNWWVLKGSYFGQGCRINLLYASLFFWLTYLFKEVKECRGWM